MAGMGHDHAPVTAAGRFRGRLAIALVIALLVLVLEVVGAILTGSLALLSDAAHVFADAAGVGFALVAATMAQRPPNPARTFGWQRLEVIAAAVNALLLIGIGIYVIVEAIRRLFDPQPVEAGLMLVIAAIGMVANLVSLLLLSAGKDESLNVRGAYLEVLGDLLGSVAVVVAAGAILLTGWERADPVASLLVAALILPRSLKLLAASIQILLEATPSGLRMDEVRHHFLQVEGVIDVHDVHAWTITSGAPALTAHVVVDSTALESCGPESMLDALQECARECFDIEHTTFQLEPADHKDHEAGTHD